MEEQKVEELKQRVKQVFSDYYELAGGKDFRFYHLRSVHEYTLELMQKEEVQKRDFDEEAVEIAALFHDIGRSEDIEDGRMNPFEGHEGHAERGAEIVDEHIDDLVEQEKLEKIEQVIRNHHSEPETVEGEILQDADELFKYGVHDLWRMFHYASEKQRPIDETFTYFRNQLHSDLQDGLSDFHFQVSRSAAEDRMQKQELVISMMESHLHGRDI
ncbi:MAG: HD domain-containing protein [Candidatus Nanohaloarchaea archaeon]